MLSLWSLVYDVDDEGEGDSGLSAAWRDHAQDWFVRVVDDPALARFPVVEVDGLVVATAIGTLEIGVPNPHCPRGRTVRLANVITVPEHRGRGSRPCSSARWRSGRARSALIASTCPPHPTGAASTNGPASP